MNTAPHPHLLVTDEGEVLTVTLDNPARRNAQTPTLWLALADLARTVPDRVRVVHLRGTGSVFSAGLDRRMLSPAGIEGEPPLLTWAAAGDRDRLEAAIAAYQEAITAWSDCPAVVIAAVQGAALGAGFHLALAADLIVLADDAVLAMPETTLGIVPDLGGLQRLVQRVGTARALEICATGRRVSAAEAVGCGLATLAVPAEQLAEATDDLAAAILAADAAAVRALKSLVYSAAASPAAQQLGAERAAQATLLIDLVARHRQP